MSHALLRAWKKTLRQHGDERAVVQAVNGATVTFRELDARATAWAGTHAPGGLKGQAVVFAAPPGIGWWDILLGLLHAGAVVVPLDAGEPTAEQRQVAATLRAAGWWDGTRLVPLAGAKTYRDPEVCLIKLTSGSTGQPRPLVFTAGQLLADARHVRATMGIRRCDLNYALIPFGHSYGLGNLTVPLLAHGMPLVCGTAPLPHAIAGDFRRWRPTVFPGVPAMWRALAATEIKLPGLRLAISAGAPLPVEVAQAFVHRFGQRLHNFYGSSETGGISYDRTGAGTLAGEVGTALRGVKLTALRGARLQVSSAAVLTRGNRHRTGKLGAWIMPDRAILRANGRVALAGRRGTSVKVGGRRVNLSEIGDRLRRLPGVREVWVGIGVGEGATLKAVVATERTAADLRADLLTDTAVWKIPKMLLTIRALPLTARGKTDTRALRAMGS